MRQLNILPIEDFLDKARIAKKSSQKTLTLTAKEYTDLFDSLASVMTRLTGIAEQAAPIKSDDNSINVDGGSF